MDMPAGLRAAVEEALRDTPIRDLTLAAETLSRRYRAEVRDGRLHLSDALFAKAYAATRLPATYAAARAAMGAILAARPDFRPKRLLDVGAGPGTMLWAASDAWWSLEAATLLETSSAIRALGAQLTTGHFAFEPEWVARSIAQGFDAIADADLVTLSYVLDELDAGAIAPLIESLWARTSGLLLVVEPGTPAGWRRILEVRDIGLRAGAHVVAPCPHAGACPVMAPDWCHFAERLARSRLHKTTKGADAPFEDEKFAYVALAREPAVAMTPRVLAPPRLGSGKVSLKLCCPDGSLSETLVTKRQGERFRAARRVDWGDALPV